MADQADAGKVWAMMEKIGFCMFSSLDGDEIVSRPMAAYVREEEGCILFLTDAESAKDEEVEARPQVNLAFADTSSQAYVSVTGRAQVSNDHEKIKELWGVPAKAWWDGPDDPSIRLLKVVPREAQFWDSPGKVRAYIKMAAAAVSDGRPAMGDTGKVNL